MACCRNLGRERQSFPPASSGISRAEDHLMQSLSSLAGCSPAIYLTRHKPHLSLDISHSGQLHTQNRIHLCPASCSDPRHICTMGQSRTEAHGLTAFGLPVGPAVIHTACQHLCALKSLEWDLCTASRHPCYKGRQAAKGRHELIRSQGNRAFLPGLGGALRCQPLPAPSPESALGSLCKPWP